MMASPELWSRNHSETPNTQFCGADLAWFLLLFLFLFCFSLFYFVFPKLQRKSGVDSVPLLEIVSSDVASLGPHFSPRAEQSYYLHSLVWLMVEISFAVVFLKAKINVAKLSEPFGQYSCNVISYGKDYLSNQVMKKSPFIVKNSKYSMEVIPKKKSVNFYLKLYCLVLCIDTKCRHSVIQVFCKKLNMGISSLLSSLREYQF